MHTLVIGGTGTVGSHLVQELKARGADVRVLTRSAEKAGDLPDGVEGVTGDLMDPSTVRSVFDGVDRVFMLNAVSASEAHEGLMGVMGAMLADADRFVYMSVFDADKAPYLPHFGSKLAIEYALKSSGLAYTILRPNSFFQNDYWLKDALLHYGVYPQPLGNIGVSRVDVRDIGDAAAIALTTDGHTGKTYNIAGPDALTGPLSAEIWSRALGKPITYPGDDLEAWEQQQPDFMPGWMVFDFKHMLALFQQHGLKATDEDLEQLTRLLGRPPRSFESFAEETAAAWQ